MENNLSDFSAMLESATPEELAEMKAITQEYINGIDVEVQKYNKDIENTVAEGEEKLAEASSELDSLSQNAQKEAEELAAQQARDAIS